MLTILDTTLRDGAQAEGIGFSLEDKQKIAQALDRLGIEMVEAGNPAANPKDTAFFDRREEVGPLSHAELVAFGATMRPGEQAARNGGLQALLSAGVSTVSLFGKSSALHVREVLRCAPEENLRMICESVAFLHDRGRKVLFDAEHFFDGYALDAPYALDCLEAALQGGASWLVLCDTNGGTLPAQLGETVAQVCRRFPDARIGIHCHNDCGLAVACTLAAVEAGATMIQGTMGGETVAQVCRRFPDARIGIHCHNDCGLAVACTLAAVEAGATMIQGTMGGIGERCGNADLSTLLPLLELKLERACLPPGKLPLLTHTARYIAEVMNLAPSDRAPFVGHAAFAHKGGMHIDGVLKAPCTFEQVPPEAVGNQRRFLVSDQSGRAGIFARLSRIMPDVERDSPEMARVLARLKQKEFKGYTYENAEGSFALMALDTLGRRPRFFEVRDFHVLCNRPQPGADAHTSAQAYIKLSVDGREGINAAEGDGPVNALDLALRKTLADFYPCIHRMRLRDFKVRVLDSGGTASTVRVSIESTDGEHIWSTVGVSSNIIQACFKALVDSVDYMLTYFGDADGQTEKT